MRTWILTAATMAALCGCGSEPKPAKPSAAAPVSKPDHSNALRRLPKTNLVDTETADQHLLGKPFMPGGAIGHYRRGKLNYDMFLSKLATANDSAMLLPDWRQALTGAHFVPSFGGYFGADQGRPVFVFTKGAWIAGVVGLTEKDADREGRVLAAQLDL